MSKKASTTDDRELVHRVKDGDDAAFAQLVRRYQRQVANLIYLTMGSRDGLDDLVQEVFIRVHRSVGRFNFESSFFSWLYRITLNLCIDEIRRRKLRRVLSLDFLAEDGDHPSFEPPASTTPEDELLREERRQKVVDALQALSPLHRQILILREYQDLPYDEIANILGISVQAVKSRLFRARSELREQLEEYMRGES